MTSDGVVGDTETALVMRLMEPHVDPSAVLLVPCLVGVWGALLQEGVADLPIDMLMMMPFNCSYRNKNEPTAMYPSLAVVLEDVLTIFCFCKNN